jgi:aspartate/methionine/tyrosine aminotransferase
MSKEEGAALLAFARERGLWIIADEVYERFSYVTEGPAPSFLDIAAPDDRLLVVNTFSKNWSMTGWRIGWLVAPAVLGQTIENLVQYNTSGVAAFMQRAGIAAIEQGEAFAIEQVARARTGRDLVCDRLQQSNRIRFARPDGAFYLLIGIEGHDDSDRLAMKLIDEAGIGLAPGTAFGGGAGERFLRLCFARSADSLAEATDRLLGWVERN